MKRNLILLMLAVSLSIAAQESLTNVYWDLIGDSTSTVAQEAFINTYITQTPLYQDGVSLLCNHPKDGIGAQTKTGVYFHEATTSKGDNYVRLTVPAGQKGTFTAAFRSRKADSEYTFYAIVQDSAAPAPTNLPSYANQAHKIAETTAAGSSYPEQRITKKYDFSQKTTTQAIYLWFPATGLRYRGFGWTQLPDTTTIDPIIPVNPDTTSTGATDSLPSPLPTLGKDLSQTIRILGIGNSFTVDMLEQHFAPLCAGQGINVVIGYPYAGGTVFTEHVQYYKNGTKAYDYRKWANGKSSATGEKTATLKQALLDEPWDMVTYQSYGSAMTYESTASAHEELQAIVKDNLTSPYKQALCMTWSDALNGTLIEGDQQRTTDSIAHWAARNYNRYGYDMIIPIGMAIQNARTSFLGDNLNRDGHHLSMCEGRYIAALVLYEIMTGQSSIGVNYHPENMTAFRALVCQEAAHAAVISPLKVTSLADKYPVEQGVDPFQYITVNGIRYAGIIGNVYMDVSADSTDIVITTNHDSTITVPTPSVGQYLPMTLAIKGADGTIYNHSIQITGARLTRYIWDMVNTIDVVPPVQDSLCKLLPVIRGEASLQIVDQGKTPGTGAQTGIYLHAADESNPKRFFRLSLPEGVHGILNLTARLGTKQTGVANPVYPFYAYSQDASMEDPTTLPSSVTIGNAYTLGYYHSLDNYDPLVMNGYEVDFTQKPAQNIYIYHLNTGMRYRQLEFVLIDTDPGLKPRLHTSLSTELKQLAASPEYKALVCAHRGNSNTGRVLNMPQSSLAELHLAISMGIDMIEVDGRKTKDGVIVNMHDASIDAFTTGSGVLANMTYEEVCQYRLINRDGTASDEPVHTFREMLEAAKDSVFIVVDVKEGAITTQMANIVNELGMMDEVMWYFPKSEQDGVKAMFNKYPKAILMPYSSTKDYLVTLHGKYNPLYIFHSDLAKIEADATFRPQFEKYNMVCYANTLNAPDEQMMTGDMSYLERMRNQNIRFIQSDYGEHVVMWLNKFNQHFVPAESPADLSPMTQDVNPKKIIKTITNGQILLHVNGKTYNLLGVAK